MQIARLMSLPMGDLAFLLRRIQIDIFFILRAIVRFCNGFISFAWRRRTISDVRGICVPCTFAALYAIHANILY